MRNLKLIFIFVFIFSAFVFLAHYWIVGSGVWGDGRYYYSYARSLIIDGDLDFSNELKHFGEPIVLGKTGNVANKYSIGPALFWLPAFLVAHLIERGDGYSHFYQILVGLISVGYGTLGLYFCFRTAKKYFSQKVALLAVFGIWLASNLFFYTAVDPINSHAISFFIASLLFFLFQKYFAEKKSWQIAVLGLLTGVLGIIRNQDLIFVLPLMFWAKNLIFLLFTFFGFFPQLLVWKIIYGEIYSPYLLAGEKFNWLNPQIFSVLFSNNNGFFYYSPILIFSLIGFYFFYRKNSFLALTGGALFISTSYIIASWHNWWGGAAYGGRMFISLMPLFIIGLGAFLDRFKRVFWFILPLVFLNFYSMIKFLLFSL